ncbi:cytochrome c biogenesis protein CcdC [Paenibacillus sp. MAHUQ-46]|uniref:Cytochrome c biogenesis protein CcdC n=2 Tax=Paenibacillus TaxID=44249 RepID=A0A934MUZ0_9BACL|nr:cytochrome c biogenesis protein CcdC [Paenibacillus roseus]
MSLIAGCALIVLRIRAGRKPTTLRKIIMPPIGMATGFIMFALPAMHIPWVWGLSAWGTGVLIFAFPLVVTTRLERRQADIYVIRSKAFIFIMASLLLIRLGLHSVVEKYMTVPQTAALFFLLAFGMIVPWRLAMVSEYIRLRGSGLQEEEQMEEAAGQGEKPVQRLI